MMNNKLKEVFTQPSAIVSGLSAIASLGLLLLHFLPLFLQYTLVGYPYEDFDEIATFNSSRVLSSPESYRCYRYGTLDTARFIAANFYYQYFDPIGKVNPTHTFSNNRPASLDDPFFVFREAAENPPTLGPDYCYFRGVNDRESILIARRIYVVSVFIATTVLVFLLLYYFREKSSLLPLAPVLLLCNFDFFSDAAWARPNAFIGVCALTIFFLLFSFITKGKQSALYLACGFVALGTAHKIDFLFYSLPVAMVALVAPLSNERPFRRMASIAAACLLAFLLPLLCFWPMLMISPVAELTPHIKVLLAIGAAASARNWSARINEFAEFARHAFHMDSSAWSAMSRNTIPMAVAFSLPFLFLTCTTVPFRTRLTLFALALFGPLHWSYIYMNAWMIVPRYMLSGMAFLMATIFCVMHIWVSSGIRWQRMLAVLLGLSTALEGYRLHQDSRFMVRLAEGSLATGRGLWEDNTRNMAVRRTVKLFQSGRFSNVVLVDQHSYIDLRYLIMNDLQPRYVHAGNFADILSTLPTGKTYLLLFTPGETSPPVGSMATLTSEDPSFSRSYQEYRKTAEALPLLDEFGTTQFYVLDWGPIGATQRTQVRLIRR
jgi:hypothetical protein